MMERTMNERSLHVVLGTGSLGLAVARTLAAQGERVRAVSRSGLADLPEGVEVFRANVTEPDQGKLACDGAAVVYHCANPPYAKWPELHPPLMQAVIDGASSTGAKLIFGDNLYAYGPVDGPLTEGLPQAATGPNGRTRARIAEELMRAHQAGRVRAAIGRGPISSGHTPVSRPSATRCSPGRSRASPRACWAIPTSRTRSPTSRTSPGRS
jgi:nucleoside-diphosphate-sugar epimerase